MSTVYQRLKKALEAYVVSGWQSSLDLCPHGACRLMELIEFRLRWGRWAESSQSYFTLPLSYKPSLNHGSSFAIFWWWSLGSKRLEIKILRSCFSTQAGKTNCHRLYPLCPPAQAAKGGSSLLLSRWGRAEVRQELVRWRYWGSKFPEKREHSQNPWGRKEPCGWRDWCKRRNG